MKLYYSDTLLPRKACAVARYLESPVEFVYIDFATGAHRQPAFLAINPNGKLPVLTDSERVVWESNAIICELAARAGSPLWPDGERLIDVIRWFSWDAEHFTRYAGSLYFEHVVRARFGLGDPDPAAVKASLASFRESARVLDVHLADRRWLVGDGLTVADFAVAVTLPYAGAIGLPLAEFPNIQRWHARLEALEAWREPFPVRPRKA